MTMAVNSERAAFPVRCAFCHTITDRTECASLHLTDDVPRHMRHLFRPDPTPIEIFTPKTETVNAQTWTYVRDPQNPRRAIPYSLGPAPEPETATRFRPRTVESRMVSVCGRCQSVPLVRAILDGSIAYSSAL